MLSLSFLGEMTCHFPVIYDIFLCQINFPLIAKPPSFTYLLSIFIAYVNGQYFCILAHLHFIVYASCSLPIMSEYIGYLQGVHLLA
jgi:hypothetical protein